MATIPIEIILQDAESPVIPTPESGEETNITVPDTGTISDAGSNSGGIGSSASIILPAIIALLAIGAIVAIIVRRYQKRKSNTGATKLSRKEKLATAASGTIAILAATVLVGNLVIPATSAATDDTNTNREGELVVDDKITITVTREADSDEAVVSSIENTSLATASYDFGYKVTASMAEGTATANLYLDGNTDSEYYIAPVSDGILTNNTWGYTLSEPTEESLYHSIPLSTKPTNIVKEVAKTVEDTAVDIYYTVQIDKDMPNGTYTGELEYTIAPAIEYMQDFSTLTSTEKTATLARMTEGKQYILKDSRDENQYYISRLKDNNVWMTQNLNLDLKDDVVLTSEDTDVSANWAPDKSTSTQSIPYSMTTKPESYDPGDFYWNGDIEKGTMSDKTSSSGYVYYHIGNYYNWSAAVASNDTSGMAEQYQNAPNSICPAGWKLPIRSGAGSYQQLVELQGLTAGTNGNIQKEPTHFVYGHSIGQSEPFYFGEEGNYWVATANSSSYAYYLDFYNFGSIYTQEPTSNRGNLMFVRCLAR